MKTILKQIVTIGLIVYGLFFSPELMSQTLQTPVSLQVENVSLEEALELLSVKYAIGFAYSDDVIPTKQKVSIKAVNTPLGKVLDNLLVGTNVQYKQVGQYIVLKAASPKHSGNSGLKRQDDSVEPLDSSFEQGPFSNPEMTRQDLEDVDHPVRNEEELDERWISESRRLKLIYLHQRDSIRQASHHASNEWKRRWKGEQAQVNKEYLDLKDSLNHQPQIDSIVKQPFDTTAIQMDTVPSNSSAHVYRWSPVAFTLVPPIGTNGYLGGQTVNEFSFSLFGSYAAGLEGFEMSAMVNVERAFVHGLQWAGISNINGGSLHGIQCAGVANVNRGNGKGGQFAGIVNINKGTFSGAQGAGLVNVQAKSMHGWQGAGLVSICKDTLVGAQTSGLFNKAKVVKGFQFGLLNFADSISGVQVGLFSYAKNGHRHLEIGGGTTQYLQAIFSTGSDAFHNNFLLAANWKHSQNGPYTWSFGYGFGTEGKLSNRVSMGIDLMAMHVNENEGFTNTLNELATFRWITNVYLTEKISLYVAPTVNACFTDYTGDSGTYGSFWIPKKNNIEDWTYDVDGYEVYTALWLGFQGGIRF